MKKRIIIAVLAILLTVTAGYIYINKSSSINITNTKLENLKQATRITREDGYVYDDVKNLDFPIDNIAPVPSLDPIIEKLLIDYYRTDVDTRGRLFPRVVAQGDYLKPDEENYVVGGDLAELNELYINNMGITKILRLTQDRLETISKLDVSGNNISNFTNIHLTALQNMGPNSVSNQTLRYESNNNKFDVVIKDHRGIKSVFTDPDPKVGVNEDGTLYIKTDDKEVTFTHSFTKDGLNYSFHITLVNKQELTSFTATKIWENGPSIKPEVTFDLYRNGIKVEGQSKVVNSGTNSVTWENLEKLDENSNEYIYSVEEQDVLGYTKTKVNNNTIKNTYAIENINYSDSINIVGGPSIKPTISFKLKKNNNVVTPEIVKTLDLNNENTFEFTNLPKTDISGNINNYDIEIENIENYIISRDVSGNITLTYVSPTDEIVANKVFVGGNSNTRPTITLQVKKNGQVVEEKVAVNTGDNINYRATFNLPRTENDGSQITYTVDEKVVPENYEKSITGMTVTNTYKIPKINLTKEIIKENGISIPVTIYLEKDGQKVEGTNKVVNSGETAEYSNLDKTDINGNNYEYKVVIDENLTNLPNGYTYINENNKIGIKYTPLMDNITKEIRVVGGNGQNLPNTIEATLITYKGIYEENGRINVVATLNDTKTAYVVTKNLPITNFNSEKLAYEIITDKEIDGYNLNKIVKDMVVPDSEFTMLDVMSLEHDYSYNYVIEKINLVNKIEKEGGNPVKVKVILLRDGVETRNEQIVLSGTTVTFTNLDKTDSALNNYNYTIKVVEDINNPLPEGYSIIDNKVVYNSPKLDIVIEKAWQGGDALIPDTIEVKVKRKTQNETNYTDFKTVLLRKDNNWQLNVTGLDSTDENLNNYEYIIEEVTQIPDFASNVNGFKITNVYTSSTKTITKELIINGGGDKKPTVKVVLFANGVELTDTEKVVDANVESILNWENMPATTNDGLPINYVLKIKEVITNPNEETGNYVNYSNDEMGNEGLAFNSKLFDLKVKVKFVGAKTLWEDVEVYLSENDYHYPDSFIVKKEDLNENGEYELLLAEYAGVVDYNNERIIYQVAAVKQIENFERTIVNDNDKNEYSITYVYNNETKNIPVDIKVVGGKDIPQISVKLVEKGTNKEVSEITLNNVNAGNFENVPVRDNVTGELKEYDVVITEPTNYVLTYENEKPVLTYVSPKTEFTANVEFVNGPSTKPNVELQLVRNGQAQDNTIKVLPNGVKTTTWNNLDLTNKDAEEYTYSLISLTEIENYTREYVGNNTVRYTYNSPKVDKEFTITREGGKTVPVRVQLVKNGVPSTNTEDTKEVLRDKVTFTNLDKTDINGNENVYTLVVTNVSNDYTPIVDNNGNITIKYTSPKIDIDVNKVWVNGDTLVPNEIEVKLQRRIQGSDSEFTDVETFKVTKDSNWKKTITNLDKTDNKANNYEYKVVELTSIANFTGIVNNFEITNTYTSPKGNKEFNVSVVGKPIEVEVKLIDKVTNTDINTQTQTTSGGLVTFSDIDLTNTNGSIKEYTTDIVTNLNGRYSKVIDTNGNITLTYIPEKVDVTKNILIPEKLKENMPEIEVEIVRDGKPTGIRKVISTNEFNNLSNIDNKLFENTITENLDKTDINGNDYTYTIKLITNIPGYETNETNNNFEITKVVDKKDLVIDMKYVGGKVRKQAVVNILKDNVVIKTVKVNDTIEVKDIELNDKYENYYNYTIEVTNTEDFTKLNYKQEINNLTIINTYESPKVELPYKAIIPNNEKPVIKIQLFKNGEPVGEVIKLDGNYEYVFKDLDKTDINGNDYNYEIRIVEQDKDFEVHTNTNGSKMLVVKKNTNYLPFAGSENNVINIILPIALIIVFTIMNKNTVNSNKYNKTFRIRRQNRRNSSK